VLYLPLLEAPPVPRPDLPLVGTYAEEELRLEAPLEPPVTREEEGGG